MSPHPKAHDPVAIIGMACLFPRAPDLARYWRNIVGGIDAIGPPPTGDPGSAAMPEGLEGGFLGEALAINAGSLGIPPASIDGYGPDHLLALRVAEAALSDAARGNADRIDALRPTTAVAVACGTYFNRGNVSIFQHTVGIDNTLDILERLGVITDAEARARTEERLREALPPFNADTVAAQVPNTMAGRIANRLDLMGPSYVVDGACASSLLAVDQASRMLRDGTCDLAVVVGVHGAVTPPAVTLFGKLGALSPGQRARSFAAGADGTVIGEGAGAVVLRRLADARAAGDRIYACVRGVGVASDGRGSAILAPRAEGQRQALLRAYRASGVSPSEIALIEGHGAGTEVGDAVELQVLDMVVGKGRTPDAPPCAIGSVKSMIGHTMPAAGMAGLIKTALALDQKVLPPSLHAETPNPLIDWDRSPLFVNGRARPWCAGRPRLAAVSAFGFGGINAHCVLEEADEAPESLAPDWESELVVFDAEDARNLGRKVTARLEALAGERPPSLRSAAAHSVAASGDGALRLAIVAYSPEDLARKLARVRDHLAEAPAQSLRMRDIDLVGRADAIAGDLAFVFPGEGSQYRDMLESLCLQFPVVRGCFDAFDGAFSDHPRGVAPSRAVYALRPGDADRLWDIDCAIESVLCANAALAALLTSCGVRADAAVGHSTGEYSALFFGAAADTSIAAVAQAVRRMNEAFEGTAADAASPATLLAVGGLPRDPLLALLAPFGDKVHLAIDTCDDQIVLCARPDVMAQVERQLRETAALCQTLPFGRPYHTPMFAPHVPPLEGWLKGLTFKRPSIQIYSCATAAPMPHDTRYLAAAAVEQWTRTVRFRETVEAMYADGVRIFVEAGPRGNLSGAVASILAGRPHLALPADQIHVSGLRSLNRLMGRLWAHGRSPDLTALHARRHTAREPGPPLQRLNAGLPLLPADQVRASVGASAVWRDEAPAPAGPTLGLVRPRSGHGVIGEHTMLMQHFLDTEKTVMTDFLRRRRPAAAVAEPAPSPLLDRVVLSAAGRHVVARRRFHPTQDLYLEHHRLDRAPSASDAGLVGLPIVPFTVTCEMMAETAARLVGADRILEICHVEQRRWLVVDEDGGCEVEVEARLDGDAVAAQLSVLEGEDRRAIAEARLPLTPRAAAAMSGPPIGEPFDPPPPSRIYKDMMFHGPRLQGVRSIDAIGRTGVYATLSLPEAPALELAGAQPSFLFDPVLLDIAGQVLGIYAVVALGPNEMVFPIRLARARRMGGDVRPGDIVTCRMRVTSPVSTPGLLRCDYDLHDSKGRLLYLVEGWTDRRLTTPSGN